MKIAICDDDKISCIVLEKLLAEIDLPLSNKNIIDVYYSGDKLLNHLEQNILYDIIFLNIEMSPINGIEVGKHIRKEMNNDIVQIVFMSEDESCAMELLDIRPLGFITKPFEKDKIGEVYFEARKLIDSNNQLFLFHKDNMTIKKHIDEILYFESDNRKVRIITRKGKENFYGKIEDVCNQLEGRNFLHIHKSYYVNYFHVTKIAYDKVTMSNGMVLPISQRRRRDIRKQHLIYDEMSKFNGHR